MCIEAVFGICPSHLKKLCRATCASKSHFSSACAKNYDRCSAHTWMKKMCRGLCLFTCMFWHESTVLYLRASSLARFRSASILSSSLCNLLTCSTHRHTFSADSLSDSSNQLRAASSAAERHILQSQMPCRLHLCCPLCCKH